MPPVSGPPMRSACEPCRKRRIRCSGERPSCASCDRLRKTCHYMPAASNVRSITTPSLQAADVAHSGAPSHEAAPQSPSSDTIRSQDLPSGPGRELGAVMPSPLRSSGSVQPYLPSNQQLVQGMPADYDIPWIAGASQQNLLEETATYDRSILPESDIIDHLVEHYYHGTNSAYPVHHAPTFRKQLLLVCDSSATAHAVDICVVLMAATSLPATSPLYVPMRHQADVFWKAALDHLPSALEGPDIRRLQVQLIQLLYVLYNPNAGRVWDLSGAALRSAVDLGLHHESRPVRLDSSGNHLDRDMRRRLFWTAYCLDRNLSFALGRPPGLADEWITTEMPLDVDDSCITTEGIGPAEPSLLKATVLHNIRIRRLQSEIHHRLYMPLSTAPSRQWYDSILQRLLIWREEMPVGTGFISPEWLQVNFHISMMMLHRPTPANPTPSEEELKLCFTSSAQAMRAYKHMHRIGRINFNWLAMYQLYIAGMTYLNSLWQAHRAGWTIVSSYVEAVLDVQVCTGLMEALSALTPGTSGIRDTFEAVSEKIIRQLSTRAMGPSRAPSPPAARRQPDTHLDSLSTDAEEMFGQNPLDAFLLNPVGYHSIEDWDFAVTSAFAGVSDIT